MRPLVFAALLLLPACGASGELRVSGAYPRVLSPERCTLDGEGRELTLSSRSDPSWVAHVWRVPGTASISVLAGGAAGGDAVTLDLLDLRDGDGRPVHLYRSSCSVLRFAVQRSPAVMRVNHGPPQRFFSGELEVDCVDPAQRHVVGRIKLSSCLGTDG